MDIQHIAGPAAGKDHPRHWREFLYRFRVCDQVPVAEAPQRQGEARSAASRRRNSPGDTPTARLKAFEKPKASW
jgi:hypothetical protein